MQADSAIFSELFWIRATIAKTPCFSLFFSLKKDKMPAPLGPGKSKIVQVRLTAAAEKDLRRLLPKGQTISTVTRGLIEQWIGEQREKRRRKA